MAQSLQEQHPDIVAIVEKWGRYQHQVNYSGFRYNRLKMKEEFKKDFADISFDMQLTVEDGTQSQILAFAKGYPK